MLELNLENPLDLTKVYLVTAISVVCALAYLIKTSDLIRSLLVFAWACFVKPMASKAKKRNSTEQQQALETFYKTQAHVYDKTRSILLKGRKECLKLSIAHLQKKTDLVWIDVGGGTGANIEYMDEVSSIAKNFKAVYLVDLSPSLCEVARARFAAKSWTNVHVLVADACDFSIPEDSADLITFSYSLSMIPNFHAAIDHVLPMLDANGVVSCVDFGVQSSETSIGRINTLGGLLNRNIPWVLRNFWRIWFEADKVYLEPARRSYLEYKFGTIKSLNAYNNKLGRIPYYLWIGCDKNKATALLHRINCLATESPYLAPAKNSAVELTVDESPMSKGHEAALLNFQKNIPYPSIYYQKEAWRVYFDEINPQYHQFKDQYIYAFTWEDPREDHRILNFTSSDTVLAITSAGDNILSYASLPNPPKRIHAVDLNPCQNHLLELKLAALRTLSRKQVWAMFGEGKIKNFDEIFYSKLAPHISSNAFQYWAERGRDTFDVNGRGLYDTGSTRWALRLARYIFKFFGVKDQVTKMCECKTIEEQRKVWEDHIKPSLFNPFVATLMVGNPIFLWKALGVPASQAKMMGNSVLRYVIDTLEPLINRSLISQDNYFYYLTLVGKYAKDNCPDYLTEKAYNRYQALNEKTGEVPLDTIRLHTDTLQDAFSRLSKKSISIAIIMDHMDWFDPEGTDAENEIAALSNCLADGARVMLRSASTKPWYIETLKKMGFSCEPAAVRTRGQSIDRVNMYASTWVCTKNDAARRRMSSLKI